MNSNKELTRTQRLLRTIEPVIYAKRWLTMTILVAATVLLAWQMVQIKTDAGFDKSIPLEHPYMKVLKQYMADFGGANRSEEHTSELQSLMRNSYDVFCLKKKKHTNKRTTKTK